MKIKKQFITSYYIVILTILAYQAMFTVYQLSQTIGFGQKISQLNTQKANMLAQQSSLKKEIAEKKSLYTLDYDLEKQFIPISSSLQVSSHTNVASR